MKCMLTISFIKIVSKAQFPVSGIFRAGGIFDNKKLLSHNYLFNVRATISPVNNEISARSENSTDWKSAFNLYFPGRVSCKKFLIKKLRVSYASGQIKSFKRYESFKPGFH